MARLSRDFRREFREKDAFLNSVGDRMTPVDFYDFLFPDLDDDARIMTVIADTKFLTVKKCELIDFVTGRDDIYFSPVQFWDNFKRDAVIDKIWAFVVDIDHLAPGALAALYSGLLRNGPLPTIITNSGHGIHLYYVLTPPLLLHRGNRELATELYVALNSVFEYKTDCHSIGHAFRAVGGLTKLGDVTSAYKCGEKWTLEELADAVDYVWVEPPPVAKKSVVATEKMIAYAKNLAAKDDVPEPNYADFNETYKFIRDRRLSRFKASGISSCDLVGNRTEMFTSADPNANPKWYYQVLQKVKFNTKISYRYTSLMALCVVAYKCRISEAELREDLDDIAEEWEHNPLYKDDPFKKKNIPDALRCYSQKFVKVRGRTIEEWLDDDYHFKRRPPPLRSQKEHLEIVAKKRADQSLQLVKQALQADPGASKSAISRRTGLSRPTVIKYYDAAKQMMELE